MVGRQGHRGMPAIRPIEEDAAQELAASSCGELVRPQESG
jgi:hypothetical protein